MDWLAFQDKFESFVGVNLWTVLFAWINLLILYLVLKKILFKPLKGMIDSRQKEVDDIYENAKAAQDTAAKLKEEYEQRIDRANEESEAILKNAVRRAQLREEEILREADQKASQALLRAQEEIELEKRRAINDVKDEVSEMAVSIASAVIGRDVSAEEHSAMIDEFINSMGGEND